MWDNETYFEKIGSSGIRNLELRDSIASAEGQNTLPRLKYLDSRKD
jgi:hypothetical protein